MKKDDILIVEIIDMGASGEGVAKVDGVPVFVPFAIMGETVKIQLNYCKKEYAFADIIEVLSSSNERINPRCVHFGKCGGCDLQHINYAKQLEIKRANLINNLRKIAGINPNVNEVIFDKEWEYRNKLSLPFGLQNGKVAVGFFEKNSHTIVPMKECPLHGEWAINLIDCVTSWANEAKLSVYDERTQKGFLRHAVARMLDTLSLTIVGNSKVLPAVDLLVSKLKAKFDNFEVYFSSNTKNTNVIFGETAKLVYGIPQKQTLGELKAQISPLSFLQVNNAIRDKIYEKVCLEIERNSKQSASEENQVSTEFSENQPYNNKSIQIVELYSGVGILTAELALRMPNAKINAVEIVPEAVADADKLMAEKNLFDRVTNICADASEALQKLFCSNKNGNNSSMTVILDPPRKGCDSVVLDAILKFAPAQIIYISCNSATLARDLKILAPDYLPTSIIPFDMFPQTKHLETLVCLKKQV
ncbi:MAG TPA: 23S rRNA (uracil(1939)-C(5))-methyltransferase RlmD [Clostridia bacterium]|nr:23S rRNA (uracil(1939)-C(5))-methyltransferase RlmD [Clostridia bacterium]